MLLALTHVVLASFRDSHSYVMRGVHASCLTGARQHLFAYTSCCCYTSHICQVLVGFCDNLRIADRALKVPAAAQPSTSAHASLASRATAAEQRQQSNGSRATAAEQRQQSNGSRATAAEQRKQSYGSRSKKRVRTDALTQANPTQRRSEA
jgi:hypothetical protein